MCGGGVATRDWECGAVRWRVEGTPVATQA